MGLARLNLRNIVLWIRNTFPNQMVRITLFCIVIFVVFFTFSSKENKIIIVKLTTIFMMLALILQWRASSLS